MLKFIIIGLILVSNVFAKTQCREELLKSPKVDYILNALKKDQELQSSFGYKVSDNKFYLYSDDDFKDCLITWDKGQVGIFNAKRPEISNGLFNFCFKQFESPCPTEDKADSDFGVIFDLTQNGEGVIQPGEYFATLVHEGFHVFGQIKPIIEKDGMKGLENWTVSDREAFSQTCYFKTDRSKSLLTQELTILRNALALSLDREPQKEKIKEHLRELASLRKERQKLTEGPFEDGTCASKEEKMEYVEGIAQFVDMRATLLTGTKSPAEIVSHIDLLNQYPTDSYYTTGGVPLLIVFKVDEKAFSKIEEKILKEGPSSRVVEQVLQWAALD